MSRRTCEPEHFDGGFTQRIHRGHFETAAWDEAQRSGPVRSPAVEAVVAATKHSTRARCSMGALPQHRPWPQRHDSRNPIGNSNRTTAANRIASTVSSSHKECRCVRALEVAILVSPPINPRTCACLLSFFTRCSHCGPSRTGASTSDSGP